MDPRNPPVTPASIAAAKAAASLERAEVFAVAKDMARDCELFKRELEELLDSFSRGYGEALPEAWTREVLEERQDHRLSPGFHTDPRR